MCTKVAIIGWYPLGVLFAQPIMFILLVAWTTYLSAPDFCAGMYSCRLPPASSRRCPSTTWGMGFILRIESLQINQPSLGRGWSDNAMAKAADTGCNSSCYIHRRGITCSSFRCCVQNPQYNPATTTITRLTASWWERDAAVGFVDGCG